jgi:hypothetical protein
LAQLDELILGAEHSTSAAAIVAQIRLGQNEELFQIRPLRAYFAQSKVTLADGV